MGKAVGRKSFTIDRSKWLRGAGKLVGKVMTVEDEYTSLYRKSDGKSCCIGIYLQACGIPKEKLEGHDALLDFSLNYEDFNDSFFNDIATVGIEEEDDTEYKVAQVWNELYTVNDSTSVYGKKREERVRKLFAKLGIKVKFKE